MLVYGASREISAWVSNQLFGNYDRFKDAEAIGVSHKGKIICGVCYEDFSLNQDNEVFACQMSIASIDKRWCNRNNLRAFFKYPFAQLSLERVWTQCSAQNEGIIMFNKRLGFKQEGIHRSAWPMGGNAISFGMLKEECRWLNGR